MTTPTWPAKQPAADVEPVDAGIPDPEPAPDTKDVPAEPRQTDLEEWIDDTEAKHQAVLHAMRDATLPTYTDPEPAAATAVPPPPLDVEAETAALAELIAFIQANKDEGTTVSLGDPDELAKGLD